MAASFHCPDCGGDGYHLFDMGTPHEYPERCTTCGGTGEVERSMLEVDEMILAGLL